MNAYSPEVLARRLLTLGGREAQVLELHLVEGASREAVAAFLGIPAASADVLIYRAARAFDSGAPSDPHGEISSAPEEQVAAERLRQCLSQPPSALPKHLGLGPAFEALVATGGALKPLLEAERHARETGPEAERREWIRRAVIALLVVVTLFLFLRNRS